MQLNRNPNHFTHSTVLAPRRLLHTRTLQPRIRRQITRQHAPCMLRVFGGERFTLCRRGLWERGKREDK